MEKKINDSSSALSRFARDKRVRTVTAAPERVERRPRPERKEGGRSERPARRASFNPNFSEENRPLFEPTERRSTRGRAAGRGRVERTERRPYGEQTEQRGERSERGRGGKPFAGKKGEGKKFGGKPSGKFSEGKRAPRRDEERPRSYPKYNPERQTGEIRLNRFLAQSGLCSRREADDFITAGLVTVNGVIVTELGTKVSPTDEVKFNDERIQGEKKVYLVLNKPKGYVTTLEDPHADKVVLDLVRGVRNGADRLDHFAVALRVAPKFHFQHGETFRLQRLFSHHFRLINPDRVHRRRRFVFIEPPNAPPRLTDQFPDQVVQRDIDGSLCRAIIFANPVDIRQNIVQLKRTLELRQIDAF